MGLARRDAVIFKAHCICYSVLSRHTAELDSITLGRVLPNIEIGKILLVHLSALKSGAAYRNLADAMGSVLYDLRGEIPKLQSILESQTGQPARTVRDVLRKYEEIVDEVSAQEWDDSLECVAYVEGLRETAEVLAERFHASLRSHAFPEVTFDVETATKVPGRTLAPASWRPTDGMMIVRFDPSEFLFEEYLRIPFVLFHEYASHVYPLPAAVCRSREYMLNGWLLGAQYEVFQSRCGDPAYGSLSYIHFNAIDPYIIGMIRSRCANQGYRLARWFYNVIEDCEKATRLATDLVMHPCAFHEQRDFHIEFCRRLYSYMVSKGSTDALRAKVSECTSAEQLFDALATLIDR